MQQMTKREFLTALAGSLYAYSDLTDEMVERQLKQFERYFSRMSEEEAQTAIADFDSTEAIAANIYELIKDKERRQSVDTGVSTEPQARTRDYDHTASDFTVVNSRTAEAQPVTAASDATVQNTGEIEATRGGSLMESSDKAGGDTINLDRVKPGGPACDTDRYRREPADNGYDVSDGAGPGFEGAHLDFTSLDDEPHQNSPLFWVLFALTFPLWGTIIITVLALFSVCLRRACRDGRRTHSGHDRSRRRRYRTFAVRHHIRHHADIRHLLSRTI